MRLLEDQLWMFKWLIDLAFIIEVPKSSGMLIPSLSLFLTLSIIVFQLGKKRGFLDVLGVKTTVC